MENPETWDALDREVAWLITKYHLDQDAGVVGLSFVRTIADFIRDREDLIVQRSIKLYEKGEDY